MKAGFAQVDISPEYFPIRTCFARVEDIIDPIFAHASRRMGRVSSDYPGVIYRDAKTH